MPNYNKRAIGSKRLNKVFDKYPNFYWTIHEGLAGTDPGDIPDQNGSDIVLSPETTDVNQWDGVENAAAKGYWWGMSTNTDAALIASRADNPTQWDEVFTFGSNTLVFVAYLFADTDPTAVGRVFTFGNVNPNVARYIEVKFLATGVIQALTDFGTQNSVNGLDLPAAAAPNETVFICKLDCANDTLTVYNYLPGSKTLQTASANSAISAPTYPTTHEDLETLAVGASQQPGAIDNHIQEMAFRDFRVINFGSNPPSDLADILEELAVNCSLGTRR